jgi:CDP-diglyceride synthetase
MQPFKTRIFALALILVCIGLVYYNWHQLLSEGRYSMKLAAFGPVGIIGGVYLLLFPSMGGKPTTAKEKIIALAVFLVGLVAGLINWYLMDPGFFGR